MKLTLLFIFIFLAGTVSAQDLTQGFADPQGKSYFPFLMGTPLKIPSDKLTIRIDSSVYKFYTQPELHFIVHSTTDYYNDYGQSIDIKAVASKDAPNARSKLTDIETFKIDTNYRNKDMTGNHLFALGNVQLSSFQASKVEWLDIDFSNGRIMELENYRKLRGISFYRSHVTSDWRLNKYKYIHDFSPLEEEGDPYFWDDLQMCPKLEALSLRSDESELLFLDEELGELLATHQIKSLCLQGMPYLPVNFRNFESIDFISLWPLYLPEAVNLAIVMNSFGKDTSVGKWSYLLAATKEKSIIIPENGTFITHYASNQTLCNGAFRNNQPDGKWEFYYDNGQLCQQRFYNMGEKTGNWLFFEPNGDTSAIFRYKNGKLSYREDRSKDHDHPCNNYEFSYDVVKKVIYQLDWKNNGEVSISKKQSSVVPFDNWEDRSPKGDTLSAIQENWHFTKDKWEYSWHYECKENRNTDEKYRTGKMGENAFYGRNVSKYPFSSGKYPDEHRFMQVSETTVDFLNNSHVETEYNDDNTNKVMKKVYELSIPIW